MYSKKQIHQQLHIHSELVGVSYMDRLYSFHCIRVRVCLDGTSQRLMIVKFIAQTQITATHLGFTDLGNEKK